MPAWYQDSMHRQARAEQRVNLRVPGGEPEERPTVLFVCVHNAGRSRMAEAFFNQMAGDRYRGLSAGTEPASRPHPEVVEAMAEVGLEIPDTAGTLLTQELADSAVRVIGMGCAVEEACPALRVPLEDWELDDPKGRSPEEIAEIRDMIELRVRNLIGKLQRSDAQQG
jgi:arsenate reductase